MPNIFKPYEEAKEFVHSLNLKSQREWIRYCKSGEKPKDIPSLPEIYYKNKGWVNYSHWLSDLNDKIRHHRFRPFELAKQFVHSLELNSQKEWIQYCNSGDNPFNIPFNPHIAYKNSGWVNYADWLGVKRNIHNYRQFLPFEEARAFAHNLNLNSMKEWSEFCKEGNIPNNIPKSPISVYKNKGWISWGDFLGNGKVHPKYRVYRPFEEARKEIRSLNLNSYRDWIKYCKSGSKSTDIPNDPRSVYKNKGWVGYSDWIGKEKHEKVSKAKKRIKIEELNLEESKLLLRLLSSKSKKDYDTYIKIKSKKK